MTASNTYIGFPTPPEFRSRITRFLEAAAAGDKRAGELYVHVVDLLTQEIIDALLLQTVDIAHINSLGQKVIHFCANTSNKASSMLTRKIFTKASVPEMRAVAKIWEEFMTNLGDDQQSDWYVLAPLDRQVADQLDAAIAERQLSDRFEPANRDAFINNLDRVIETIIHAYFLKSADQVNMGPITRKMLSVGVDTVKAAVHGVLHKVVKPLDGVALAHYLDHASQFFKKAP
jgi:hypothetical protein